MPKAFLDASVLYPALVRDALMRLALHGLFQAHWSPLVQEEWRTALLRDRRDLCRDQIERTCRLMDQYMPDASVTGFEHRIEALVLPDQDDRHVLAAAIHCGAQAIVTANLRDFPAATLSHFALVAMHPDAFIEGLVRADEIVALTAMRRMLSALTNPPMSGIELLSAFRRHDLPASAQALARLADQ